MLDACLAYFGHVGEAHWSASSTPPLRTNTSEQDDLLLTLAEPIRAYFGLASPSALAVTSLCRQHYLRFCPPPPFKLKKTLPTHPPSVVVVVVMASTHYSENDTLFPLAGGCACGFIRYELGRAPLIVNCCHCTACQRQTGSAFAINAVIESASIRLLPSAAPTFAGSAAKPEPTPAAVMPAFAASTDAAIPPALAGGGEQSQHQPKPLPVCIPSGSGLGTTVAQCPECRTGLWNHYADAGCHLSYVRVGTLDKPWAVAPDVHIYTRSRRSFIDISDGKPQFEDYYPSREALMREDALERVKAMKPLVEQWKAELKRKIKL